ncbi:Putative ribonuclease H protein At1g65750, partial [Linum perenne]
GGLGFRCFKEFNLSFLAKLAWKIIQQPEALWVRLLKALYFPNEDFITVPKRIRSSWIWSSIMKGRDSLIQGIRRSIGNGRSTWLNEAWFPGAEDFKCHPSPEYNCRVSECINHERRCWKLDKLRSIIPESTVVEIIKIPIASPGWEDGWIWHDDKRGKFSIKSCYSLLKNGRNSPNHERQNTNEDEWKWLWHLTIPPKVKFFLWTCCTNTLPTLKNLHRRKCNDSPVCLCCGGEEETVEHMLMDCPQLRGLWAEAFEGNSPPRNIPSGTQWIMALKEQQSNRKVLRSIGCCWTIWKMRNDIVFSNGQLDLRGMKVRMEREVSQWEMASKPMNQSNPRPEANNEDNVPLPTSFQKEILCDGSFQKDTQKAEIKSYYVKLRRT